MARILVIDDDKMMRETLRAMIEDAGHDVVEAAEGADGMKQIDAGGIDLVITDLIMPGKEGIETICELQVKHRELPIIAISGGSPMGYGTSLHSAEALGAKQSVEKPFTQDEMLAAVNRVLDG